MTKPKNALTIYVLTSGSYSDYSIYGVFSSKDKARKALDTARNLRDDDGDSLVYWASDANIEEWPINELLKHRVQRVFSCGIELETGRIIENPNPAGKKILGLPFRSEITQEAVKVPAYGCLITRVQSTVSNEHAIKVATESRQAWLRNQAGTPKEGK